MVFPLVNLRVYKMVVHQIFERKQDGSLEPPKYTDAITTLSSSGNSTFQNRIIDALGDDSHSIEMFIVDSNAGSMFDRVSQILDASDDRAYIGLTQGVALKLAGTQISRHIPGGIVLIFSGLIGNSNNRYVGIIKAELHGGFNLEQAGQTMVVKFISDLFLTPQTRLYKIALFIENNGTVANQRTTDCFRVQVFDHIMTRTESRSAAKYFYEAFLGCDFSPSDKKLTADFYYNTKDFINTLDIPDEQKVDLQTSLYSYLKVDQSAIIQVSKFADDFLPQNSRDNYQQYMAQKDLPGTAINKDLTNLKYKLRTRNIMFTSKVKIIAPPDNFDDLVKIIGNENGYTTVSIQGEVAREI